MKRISNLNILGLVFSFLCLPLSAAEFDDDFDPQVNQQLWSRFQGDVRATQFADLKTWQLSQWGAAGNSLWFGGAGQRFAETVPFDTSDGATVKFKISLAKGSSSLVPRNPTWENVESSEEIYLEYSIDGSIFHRIAKISDRDWTERTFTIPSSAWSTETRFRWIQPDNSGRGYDHWAIDDVVIELGSARPRGLKLRNLNLTENLPSGSPLATLEASHDVVNTPLIFALVESDGDSADADNAVFTLTEEGILTLNQVTDFETQSRFRIKARVSDPRGRFLDRSFVLNLVDDRQEDFDGDSLTEEAEEDIYGTSDLIRDTDGDGYEDNIEVDEKTDPLDYFDNPNQGPVALILDNLTVEENQESGFVVGILTALDPDSSGRLTLGIAGSEATNSQSLFFLGGAGGNELRISRGLDFEEAESHTITLFVRDQFNQELRREFMIQVQDDRNEDFDRDGYSEAVEEDVHGTSDLSVDSDGDGYYDREEIVRETDPTSSESFPADEPSVSSDWIPLFTPPSHPALNAVCGSDSLIVAVGTVIETTSDGQIWETQVADLGGVILAGVLWTGNQFVAVGNKGTIMTSSNGRRWVEQESGSTTLSFVGITQMEDGLFAVAHDTVLFSEDGRDWTVIGSGPPNPVKALSKDAILYVAGQGDLGDGFVRYLQSSTDGINWTIISDNLPGFTDLEFDGVTFWLAGSGGTIHRSGDGVSWVLVKSGGFGYDSIGIAPDGNLFTGPTNLTSSSDGQTWETVTHWSVAPKDFFFSERVSVVIGDQKAYLADDGRWLPVVTSWTRPNDAVVQGDRLFTCGPLGEIWERDSLGEWILTNTSAGTGLASLASSGSVMVAVGNNGVIMRSANLGQWAAVETGISENLSYVIWDGGRFLASGKEGKVYTAEDGLAWNLIGQITTSFPHFETKKIIFEGGKYHALFGTGIYSSMNAVTWTQVYSNHSRIEGIAYNGQSYSAVTTEGVLYSIDGGSWSGSGFSVPDASQLRSWDLIAEQGEFLLMAGNRLLRSPDGLSWEEKSRTPDQMRLIRVLGDELISLGFSVLSSTDQVFWKYEFNQDDPRFINPLVLNGELRVYDTTRLDVLDSDLRWQNTFVRISSYNPSLRAKGMVWNGNEYLAVFGSRGIVRSQDGISWGVPQRFKSGAFRNYFGMAWNGVKYVAIGSQGAIADSATALRDSWTIRILDPLLNLNEVSWHGSYFFASGRKGQIPQSYRSTDGSSWSLVNAPIRHVTFNGSRYIGIGDGVHTSIDGVTWNRESADFLSGFRLAANGVQILAVGNDQAFTSTDGTSWVEVPNMPERLHNIEPFKDGFFVYGSEDGFVYEGDGSVNFPPTNIGFFGVIREGVQVGSMVGLFSASDPDDDEVFLFQLFPGEGDDDNNLFSLEGIRRDTLIGKAVFDQEVKSEYRVRVRVTDRSGDHFEKSFVIPVEDDRSEDADGDGLSEAQEEETYGTSDIDRDSDGDGAEDGLEVSLGFDPSNPSNSPFTRPTGLTLSSLEIPENSSEGFLIGNLKALDPDVNETLSFSLVAGNGDSENQLCFLGGGERNELRCQTPVDFEQTPLIRVRIRVTDSRGLFVEEPFLILVLDDNQEDEDGDGLTEVQEEFLGTSDLDSDSDDDGVSDDREVLFGSNPLDAESVPILDYTVSEGVLFEGPSDQADDRFGQHVEISGRYLAIGAEFEGPRFLEFYGAVYVYDVFTGELLHKLVAEERKVTSRFGKVFQIFENTIVVGAPEERPSSISTRKRGAAYVFDLVSGNQIARLTEPMAASDQNQEFGTSVAISEDHILIGSPGSRSDFNVPGAAHLFKRKSWAHVGKLTVGTDFGSDVIRLGEYVALSEEYALLQSRGRLQGGGGDPSVFRFDLSNPSLVRPYNLSLSDNETLFGEVEFLDDGFAGMIRGSSLVFVDGNTGETGSLISGFQFPQNGRTFGVTDAHVLIGSPTSAGGRAVLLRRADSSLIEIPQKIEFSDDFSGRSVAINGSYFAIGNGNRQVLLHRIQPGVPSSYRAALYGAGGGLDDSTIVDDLNDDGITNGLAYALGIPLSGPVTSDELARLPRAAISDGGKSVVAFITPSTLPEDLILCLEVSSRLGGLEWIEIARKDASGSWTGLGASEVIEQPIGGDTVKVTSEYPQDQGGRGFMRLRAVIKE